MDYLFIFPLHMGILGAVLATATAPIPCAIPVKIEITTKERLAITP